MKPHKHAELIKAWADGAPIEFYSKQFDRWVLADNSALHWHPNYEYRIMPKPKPDVVKYVYVTNYTHEVFMCEGFHEIPNLKLTWDGETNKLKLAEVLE